METIREHKAVVALAVAAIAAVLQLVPGPEGFKWAMFGVFMVAFIFILALAFRSMSRTTRFRNLEDPSADEEKRR